MASVGVGEAPVEGWERARDRIWSAAGSFPHEAFHGNVRFTIYSLNGRDVFSGFPAGA